MANFADLQQVKSGPLFDVFRARLDGRPVYVKSVAGHTSDSARRVALASTWTDSDPTNVFHGRHMGWKDSMEEARPGLAHYEALLHAEYTVVERVHQHWNHPGAQLMRRRGDELVAEGGNVCLVIPACEGTPLARFSPHEQRKWIPDMLPALWRALAHCPHGDLSPDNLLIDPTRRFFRILDPGVRIDGPSSRYPRGLEFKSTLFTTNTARYPLLLPEHGPDRPRLCAPYAGLLARQLEAYSHSLSLALFGREAEIVNQCGPSFSPAAADLIAIGAMYAFALTGAPLHELLKLEAPLWAGYWDYRGRNRLSTERLRYLEVIEGGELLRSLQAAGATGDEAELCVRLIALRIQPEEDLTTRYHRRGAMTTPAGPDRTVVDELMAAIRHGPAECEAIRAQFASREISQEELRRLMYRPPDPELLIAVLGETDAKRWVEQLRSAYSSVEENDPEMFSRVRAGWQCQRTWWRPLAAVRHGPAACEAIRAQFASREASEDELTLMVQSAVDPELLIAVLGPTEANRWVTPMRSSYAQFEQQAPSQFENIQAHWQWQRNWWRPLVEARNAATKRAAVPRDRPAPSHAVDHMLTVAPRGRADGAR